MSLLFPQLRVRTGFTFRDVYGKVADVVARLKELNAPVAGIVDHGTWVHARMEKAAKAAELPLIFGMEVPIQNPNGLDTPRAWILAKPGQLRDFYRATSYITQAGSLTPEGFGALQGVVRFSGGAVGILTPDQVDYVDINPASYGLAVTAMDFIAIHGTPGVVTSYNDMPSESDADFAYSWEVRDSVNIRHIATMEEIHEALKPALRNDVYQKIFAEAVAHTHWLAKELSDGGKGQELNKAPIIHTEGDMVAWARAGQAKRLAAGHIAEWTDAYEERLQEEIRQIQLKGFDSYFLVVADLIRYAKEHMLVGPARGSSAGSLVCYLMEITNVDPLPYGLLFQRFIDISREDFPDIDIDFDDTKRYMVFDYLREKYGVDHVSKVGNVNTLQPLSALNQGCKKFGINLGFQDGIRSSMVAYAKGDKRYGHALEDTFEIDGPGADFKHRHPEAARCMAPIESHPSHTGVHAAGIIVCNDPVTEFCTVTADGVAQIDKNDAEYLNLLKIDVLGLRTLGIIADSGAMTSDELYSMTFEDQAVLDILNEGKVSGVFQFEGPAIRELTRQVPVDSFSKIDTLTAMGRPGPLSSGMAQKYVDRAQGKEAITYPFPELEEHLASTAGVILYQEQIMSICRGIGGFDWPTTSKVRKAMAKSMGAEVMGPLGEDFVKGAVAQGIPAKAAAELWDQMCAFGAYGFNKSHAVAYGMVTYWTLYLKRYHKLEFAAACLREAKSDEQTVAILRELVAEGVTYTAMDPVHSEHNWKVADGRLVGGIMNAKGFGPGKALKFIELRNSVVEARRQVADIEAELEPPHVADARQQVAAIEANEQMTKTAKARDSKLFAAMIKEFEKEKKARLAAPMKVLASWDRACQSLANTDIMFGDLNEAHTKFGHFYEHPRLAGVTSGNPIQNINEVKDGDDGLVIVKLVTKKLLDENSADRAKRRGGKPYTGGQSKFLDLSCVDDSTDTPIRFRIKPDKYLALGKSIFDDCKPGTWFLIKGWKIKNFEMFIVKNIKILEGK